MGRRRFLRYPDTPYTSALGTVVRRNLLRNPSFELGTSYVTPGASVTVVRSNNEFAPAAGIWGLSVLGVAAPETSTSTVFQPNDPARPITAGQRLRTSISARQSSAVGPVYARMYVNWWDASNGVVGTPTFGPWVQLGVGRNADQTQYVLVSAPAPAGAVSARSVVQFAGDASGANPPANFTAHIDAWMLEVDAYSVSVVGDSLVRGYTGTEAWPLEDAMPAQLQPLLPGSTVINRGFGGRAVDEVRFLWPSFRPTFTPARGEIPAAAEPVALTAHTPGLGLNPDFPLFTNGTLGGILGQIRYDATGWSFTRAAAGNPVPVDHGEFIVARPDERNNLVVLWAGRNDLNYGIRGGDASVADHVVASYQRLVDDIGHDRYVLIPPMNQPTETDGTANHTAVVDIDTRLKAMFGDHVLDVRRWFVDDAIYDLGLTPTQADLDAIAADAPPPQITDAGGSHYIKPAAPLIAQLVADKITALGYDDKEPVGGSYFDGSTPSPGWDLRTAWEGTPHDSTSVLYAADRSSVWESIPAVVTMMVDEYESRGVELLPATAQYPIVVYPYRTARPARTGRLEALFAVRDEAQQLVDMAGLGLIVYQDEDEPEYTMILHPRRVSRTYLAGYRDPKWTVSIDYTRTGDF